MDWREVIHECLKAKIKWGEQFAMVDSVHHLDAFCSRALNVRRLKEHERCQRIVRTAQSPETYVLVKEAPLILLANVGPVPDGEPFMQTRFRLIKEDDKWVIDGHYIKCPCEGDDGTCFNCKLVTPGLCSACKGTGWGAKSWWVKRKCFFCNGSGKCPTCKGSGKCDICKDSDMPGWNPMPL